MKARELYRWQKSYLSLSNTLQFSVTNFDIAILHTAGKQLDALPELPLHICSAQVCPSPFLR